MVLPLGVYARELRAFNDRLERGTAGAVAARPPATGLSPRLRAASPKTSIKPGCGCGPDAPSMTTQKSVAATRSMRSRTSRIAGLDPMSGAAPSARWRTDRGARPCARSTSRSSAASWAAVSRSWQVQPSSIRAGSKTASMRARVCELPGGISKHMRSAVAGSGSSRTAIERARTSSRNSS